MILSTLGETLKFLMIFFVLLFGLKSYSKQSCTSLEFSKRLSQGLPKGAESILNRIIECNHWGGEVGDASAERNKQILEGVERARCKDLDKDRSELMKKHPSNKKLVDALSAADSWKGSCE